MSLFSEAVNAEMLRLADDPRSIFVGQSVRYDGAAIFDSLKGVPMDKRLEMPVIEDFQMGFCTGLALAGRLPICIFPRMDFMLLCLNQLVNHLDKLPLFGWHPKVIIRTTVGGKKPLDAGPQHTQDHTEAFRLMLQNIKVIQVTHANTVPLAYDIAISNPGSTLIVENPSWFS
jgi:pyruvate dehydrogenase E1 component beta subunit